ncbi:hypothetical protein E2C01_084576 [Portunus trituberculatus]|uniref:Uncharacterized protein n=1 Tax=Portunus trituberculatus TaxID=210409 RepID=A0A5B7J0D7_PORTR|nr:hypothetical protein [Portunus trituberculatus]
MKFLGPLRCQAFDRNKFHLSTATLPPHQTHIASLPPSHYPHCIALQGTKTLLHPTSHYDPSINSRSVRQASDRWV